MTGPSSRRFANRATMVSLPFVVLTALLVLLSPIVADVLEPHRPSGAVLAWGWVRLLTRKRKLQSSWLYNEQSESQNTPIRGDPP